MTEHVKRSEKSGQSQLHFIQHNLAQLTFSLPLAPIVTVGLHLTFDNEGMVCTFGMLVVHKKDRIMQMTHVSSSFYYFFYITKHFQGRFAHSTRVTDHWGSRFCCPQHSLQQEGWEDRQGYSPAIQPQVQTSHVSIQSVLNEILVFEGFGGFLVTLLSLRTVETNKIMPGPTLPDPPDESMYLMAWMAFPQIVSLSWHSENLSPHHLWMAPMLPV